MEETRGGCRVAAPGASWRDLCSQPLTANRFHLSRVGPSTPARPRPTKDGRPTLLLRAQKSRARCAVFRRDILNKNVSSRSGYAARLTFFSSKRAKENAQRAGLLKDALNNR